MKISSIKELQQVIALCKKQGVTAIEIDGIKLEILAKEQAPQRSNSRSSVFSMPSEASIKVPRFHPITGQLEAEQPQMPEELTPEQLMFYSTQPEASEQ